MTRNQIWSKSKWMALTRHQMCKNAEHLPLAVFPLLSSCQLSNTCLQGWIGTDRAGIMVMHSCILSLTQKREKHRNPVNRIYCMWIFIWIGMLSKWKTMKNGNFQLTYIYDSQFKYSCCNLSFLPITHNWGIPVN